LKEKERKWNNPQYYLPARETPEINQQKSGQGGTRGIQSKCRTKNCVDMFSLKENAGTSAVLGTEKCLTVTQKIGNG
jgi:hypothetical protein